MDLDNYPIVNWWDSTLYNVKCKNLIILPFDCQQWISTFRKLTRGCEPLSIDLKNCNILRKVVTSGRCYRPSNLLWRKYKSWSLSGTLEARKSNSKWIIV